MIKSAFLKISFLACLTLFTVLPFARPLFATDRQVTVETRIIETQDNFSDQLCIDGLHDDGAGNLDTATMRGIGRISREGQFSSPSTTGGFGDGVGSINFRSINMQNSLRLLEEKRETDVVSEPNLITVNNEQARVIAGEQIPYQEENSGTEVDFKEAVIRLNVTPQVTDDGQVRMELTPEVNNPAADLRPVQSNVIVRNGETAVISGIQQQSGGSVKNENPDGMPELEQRKAETNVLTGDGNTVVVGGLINNPSDTDSDSVPQLSKVPGLGRLFRNQNSSESQKETVIVVTPHIVPVEEK